MPQNFAVLLGNPLFLLAIFFVMIYFLTIRPQQQQQKRRQEMLSGLKRGDRIVTVGGIRGTIVDLREDNVTLRVARDVDIDIVRSGIGRVERPAEDKGSVKKEDRASENKEGQA